MRLKKIMILGAIKYFFVVLACNGPVLDGFDQLLSICTVHSLPSAPVDKSQQYQITEKTREL